MLDKEFFSSLFSTLHTRLRWDLFPIPSLSLTLPFLLLISFLLPTPPFVIPLLFAIFPFPESLFLLLLVFSSFFSFLLIFSYTLSFSSCLQSRPFSFLPIPSFLPFSFMPSFLFPLYSFFLSFLILSCTVSATLPTTTKLRILASFHERKKIIQEKCLLKMK